MAEYIYEIIKDKKIQKGKIHADSITEAALQIKKPGWFISELKDVKQTNKFLLFFGSKPRFPSYDKINFTDHLASSVGAGTPLQEALEAYVEEGDRKSEIIDTINKDIQRGKKLSEAMEKYPTIFPPLYIALVQAGEITGSLDETLEYLANELRREHEFIAKVKSAMFYPIIVLCVSLIVVIVVIGFVVPKMVDIMKSFGGELPTITKILVAFAQFLVDYKFLIILSLVLMVGGLIYVFKNQKVRMNFNAKITKSPLIGDIMRQFILARFLRIIGGCVKYGIQLPKAVELSAGVVDNVLYKQACENINKKIIRGQNLSMALADEDKELFPPIISRTIRGGEKTSKVDVGLLRLSTYYEAEVERSLKRLTEMIEPVMVIVLGVFVALIAIAVITPIYQMTSRIQ
jgi:type IV pilus assembly protein PilC